MNMKTKQFLKQYVVAITTSFFAISGNAGNITIIPQPNFIKEEVGEYLLESKCRVSYTEESIKKEAQYLQSVLTENNLDCSIQDKRGNIRLGISNLPMGNESYRLTIDQSGVSIEASSASGIFYGIQTLRQVIKKGNDGQFRLPFLSITDKPAFKWRAFMLDDGRAFKGIKVVKQLLDEMSLLKMNTFHWHLTDDQGWRIEIKKYPKLTKIGAFRDSTQLNWYENTQFDGVPFGGYYTQKQIKEIIAYAKDRYIQIIPEIEMPGHASAAIAAYPWLGTTGKKIKVPCAFGVQYEVFNIANPKVQTFLKHVLDEVLELFPSEIIHIGGDEVKFDYWNTPEVKDYMKLNNLNTPAELQLWFNNHMSDYLSSKGRRMMGWNDITGDKIHGFQTQGMEIASNLRLNPSSVIQFWVGDIELLTKAASKGYELINSFHEYTYLNYNHDKITPGLEYSFAPIPLSKAYSFSPVPENLPEELKKNIVGVGCQMWGEWIPTEQSMNKMVYPYLAAHAETGWTQQENKSFDRFISTLSYFLNRWVQKGYLPDKEKTNF